MKRILVPTDFSENALKAAMYAAEIARKNGATIYAVHVVEPTDTKVHQPFPLHERFTQLVNEQRMSELRKFIKPISESYKEIQIKIKLLKGDPVHAISNFSNNKQIDLLVMGTKGASGLKEVLVGSVTANCIASSEVPVLAIPEEYTLEQPDALVFVTSHFERNSQVLDTIMAIAGPFNATIHTVLFEENDVVKTPLHNDHSEELKNYIEFLRQKYPGVSFKAELLEGTSFEGAIERYEIKNQIDIIAMVTYPKGILSKIFGKRVTKKMAFHTRIPLLSIPVARQR